MKFSFAIAFVLATAAAVEATVTSLTPSNFDAMTQEKEVFIKFFAPWCGHCKQLAPEWEKLADEYENNTNILVAEVDCSSEDDGAQDLCEKNGVKMLPTLKYGNPKKLSDYEGGKTYETLSKFASINLGPKCSLTTMDVCNDEQKAQIKEYKAMSAEELDAAIEVQKKKLEEINEEFESTKAKKMQETIEKMSTETEEERQKMMKEERLPENFMEIAMALQKMEETLQLEKTEKVAAVRAEGLEFMEAVQLANKFLKASGSEL